MRLTERVAGNFRQGICQAPRTTWRHWPLVPATALTALVLAAGVVRGSPGQPAPAGEQAQMMSHVITAMPAPRAEPAADQLVHLLATRQRPVHLAPFHAGTAYHPVPRPTPPPAAPSTPPPAPQAPAAPSTGIYSYGQLEALWVSAGGPSWAEAQAATVAECESGGDPQAQNPSGASGLWQILGQVVPGNIFDPMVNAENAVAKFNASGQTFAQWVCQP